MPDTSAPLGLRVATCGACSAAVYCGADCAAAALCGGHATECEGLGREMLAAVAAATRAAASLATREFERPALPRGIDARLRSGTLQRALARICDAICRAADERCDGEFAALHIPSLSSADGDGAFAPDARPSLPLQQQPRIASPAPRRADRQTTRRSPRGSPPSGDVAVRERLAFLCRGGLPLPRVADAARDLPEIPPGLSAPLLCAASREMRLAVSRARALATAAPRAA